MPATRPVRKSARARVPNKLYSPAPLQAADFGDSDEEAVERLVDELQEYADGQDEEDEDFDEQAFEGADAEEAEEAEEEDEVDEAAEAEDVAASDDDSIETADEDDFGRETVIDLDGRTVETQKDSQRNDESPWRWALDTQPLENNVRGIGTRVSHTNKPELLRELFASDSWAVDLAQQKWMRDPCFPHKTSGVAYPAGFKDGLKDPKSEEQSSKPYFPPFDQSLHGHRSDREAVVLDIDQAQYLPTCSAPLALFAGPYNKQHEYELGAFGAMDIKSFFPPKVQVNGELNTEPKPQTTPRKGWVLNTSGRVLCMAWAPIAPGQPQYLAVAVEKKTRDNKVPEPFRSPEPYPASIQIWRFSNDVSSGESAQMSVRPGEPKLVRVICAEWGSPKKLSWCPGLSGANGDGRSNRLIGFLGIIWADGYVRVLEVDEPTEDGEAFSLYKTPLFTSKPPGTMCSCLDWITSTDLAVGCANGYVAIWNIPKALKNNCNSVKTSVKPPRPWFYHCISDTYVNSIAAVGPTAPHLLQIISVSGYQRLFDIRMPEVEYVESLRSRIYQSSTAYLPHLQAFMTTDENGDVVCLLGRRFFNSRRIAPTISGASGGAIVATSPLHCSVLFSTPDGIVSCTSPLIRVLQTRSKLAFAQKWFVHEWRQARPKEGDDQNATEGGGVRRGVVRMTEGYKLERVPMKFKVKEKDKDRTQQAAFVFEEEQAVTALAWNPNLECGTWAAAGTGSGLLRVEDVAVSARP